jgi:hypothetical protein
MTGAVGQLLAISAFPRQGACEIEDACESIMDCVSKTVAKVDEPTLGSLLHPRNNLSRRISRNAIPDLPLYLVTGQNSLQLLAREVFLGPLLKLNKGRAEAGVTMPPQQGKSFINLIGV